MARIDRPELTPDEWQEIISRRWALRETANLCAILLDMLVDKNGGSIVVSQDEMKTYLETRKADHKSVMVIDHEGIVSLKLLDKEEALKSWAEHAVLPNTHAGRTDKLLWALDFEDEEESKEAAPEEPATDAAPTTEDDSSSEEAAS